MRINDIINITKQGKICKLPNFEGYFKWDFNTNSLVFYNKDYKCPATFLDILNRDDFYYIT